MVETGMMPTSTPQHLAAANTIEPHPHHHHPQSLLPYHHPSLGPLGLQHPALPSRPISPDSLERMKQDESKTKEPHTMVESENNSSEKLPLLDSSSKSQLDKMSQESNKIQPLDSDPVNNNNNNNVELQHST